MHKLLSLLITSVLIFGSVTAVSADWHSTSFGGSVTVTENPPPSIHSEQPPNSDTDIDTSLSLVSVYISDDSNSFNYTIEGSFLTNEDVTSSSNGTKTATITSLDYSTTYTWYVNATDGNSWTNKTYTFTTESGTSSYLWHSSSFGGSVTVSNETQTSFTISHNVTQNCVEINITVNASSLEEFVFNWNGTNYTIYNDSLLLSYNFNNNSKIGDNETYCVDITGKYNATLNDLTYAGGKYNQSINLTSLDQYAYTEDVELVGNQLSISWWMYVRSNSGLLPSEHHAPIVVDWMIGGTPYTNGTFLAFIKTNPTWSNGNFNTNCLLCSYHSEGQLNDLGTNFTDWYHSWHHITYTLNGTDQRIYVDGKLDANNTGSSDIVANAQELALGWKNWNYGEYFDGKIDEFRVYNRTLSPEEIEKTYNSEFQKYTNNSYIYNIKICNLSAATYHYYAYASTTQGDSAQSETGEVDIVSYISWHSVSFGGSVEVTSPEIDVSVSPQTWTIGTIAVGSNTTKNFTLWQNGSSNIDITIGINSTNLTFVDYSTYTSNGHNQYACNLTVDSNEKNIDDTTYPFSTILKSNFPTGNFTFTLKIFMPKTLDSLSVNENFDIVISASQST